MTSVKSMKWETLTNYVYDSYAFLYFLFLAYVSGSSLMSLDTDDTHKI